MSMWSYYTHWQADPGMEAVLLEQRLEDPTLLPHANPMLQHPIAAPTPNLNTPI